MAGQLYHPLLRLALGLLGMGAFCIYSRSWRDVPHLVYDVPAALATFTFIGQLIVEAAASGAGAFWVGRAAMVGALSVITLGREFLHWPISGHLSCVLAVALVQSADPRLAGTEKLLYWLPVLTVIAIRWSLFDRGEHWQTYSALVAAVLLAVPVLLLARMGTGS